MGQVIQAGAGQIPARQAAVKGGIPMTVPSITINKVCLSGINAIALADQLIRAGECEIVVAGGMESMTQAPHLLPKSPRGLQVRRRRRCVDSMAYDALYDQFTTRRWASSPSVQRRRRQPDPRGAGRLRGRSRTSVPPWPGRTASSTTRSSR